jgi:hypothetical protein
MESVPLVYGSDGPTYLPALVPGMPLLSREATVQELLAAEAAPPASPRPARAVWWMGVGGPVWLGEN